MKEKRKTVKSKLLYMVGGISIVVGALIIVPKLMGVVADYLYLKQFDKKQQAKNAFYYDDDWGPEIVKTSELNKEEKQYGI